MHLTWLQLLRVTKVKTKKQAFDSTLTRGQLEEFETVMQNQDAVESLHNSQEFSQHPECLDEAM